MITKLGLDIPSNRNSDYTFEHKFGSIDPLVAGSQTIWSYGGLYPWAAFDTAGTLSLVSTDAADTDTIVLYGLDADWKIQTETVTLNGLTPVNTSLIWKRMYRMVYNHTGSNIGEITASKSGSVVGHVPAGKGQSLMCVYTTPADTLSYGLQITYGIGKGGDALFSVNVRDNHHGTGFRVRGEVDLYQTTFTQTYSAGMLLYPKSDIDVRAFTGGNNFKGTASFDLVIES